MGISDWSSDVCSSDLGEDGFPHSEICGSKFAHNSPQLIAACHVLHRLCMPRHPPNALTSRLRIHTTNNNTANERSEERRVGQECVRTSRSRWSTFHYTKHIPIKKHRTNTKTRY